MIFKTSLDSVLRQVVLVGQKLNKIEGLGMKKQRFSDFVPSFFEKEKIKRMILAAKPINSLCFASSNRRGRLHKVYS